MIEKLKYKIKDRKFIKVMLLYLLAFTGGMGIVGPLFQEKDALKQLVIATILLLIIFTIFECNFKIVTIFYSLFCIGVLLFSRNSEAISDLAGSGMFSPDIFYILFRYISFGYRELQIPITQQLNMYAFNALVYVIGVYLLNICTLILRKLIEVSYIKLFKKVK